ncbi:MarR family winged helix-turn-helix transcriptional regulator [Pseudochelatococcus sp. B33]
MTSSYDRIAHLLKLTSKSAARALQTRLAREDINYGFWTFLRILWEQDDLTITELSQAAGVAKPAVVNAIQAMEARGFVTRVKRDGNAKAVYVRLTDEGRALQEKLVPYAQEVNAIAMRGYSDKEIEQFRQQLLRILKNLEDAAE